KHQLTITGINKKSVMYFLLARCSVDCDREGLVNETYISHRIPGCNPSCQSLGIEVMDYARRPVNAAFHFKGKRSLFRRYFIAEYVILVNTRSCLNINIPLFA